MQKDSDDSDLFTPMFKAWSLSSAFKKVILGLCSIFCLPEIAGFKFIKQIRCYLIFFFFARFYFDHFMWSSKAENFAEF